MQQSVVLRKSLMWCAALMLIAGTDSYGHFQQFEDADATEENPIEIVDCQIAFAWYGTINYPGDVDYFKFEGDEGEEVILYLLFPVIENAEDFYPSMALIGPGLPDADLPESVMVPEGSGAQSLEYSLDRLDEMAHGRVYKYPTPMELALPATGTYYVAFWSDDRAIGRYCFSHGTAHENASSDPDAETKIEEFWTPLTKTVQLSEDASPLRLVRVPRGSFSMGSPVAEADRAEDEAQHSVTLSQSFYMSQFEITQGQWTALMDANPSQFSGEPNRPVENVSWSECQAFIEELNSLDGVDGAFRLATEAEWEYACRAGEESRFYWGDDSNLDEAGDFAWFDSASNGTPQSVGQKLTNAWGLYDMSGNVWEWCSDWYETYSSDAAVDPEGPATGEARVIRGGGWNSNAATGRCACRESRPESDQSGDLGFRVVLELPKTAGAGDWELYQ